MMYEMLTGAQPFVGDQPMQIAFQHANDQVPTPSAVEPVRSRDLDELVLWATAKDPDRPADATPARCSTARSTSRRCRPPGGDHGRARTWSCRAERSRPPARRTPVTSASTDRRAPGPQKARPRAAAPLLPRRGQRSKPRDGRRASRRRGWSAVRAASSCSPALAGGTGWYFGSGPGAHRPDPERRGQDSGCRAGAHSRSSASWSLARDRVQPRQSPVGTVVGTDPASGAHVDARCTVTLVVSQGPRQIDAAAVDRPAGPGDGRDHGALGVRRRAAICRQFDAKAARNRARRYGVDGASLAVDRSSWRRCTGEAQPVTSSSPPARFPMSSGLTRRRGDSRARRPSASWRRQAQRSTATRLTRARHLRRSPPAEDRYVRVTRCRSQISEGPSLSRFPTSSARRGTRLSSSSRLPASASTTTSPQIVAPALRHGLGASHPTASFVGDAGDRQRQDRRF